MRTLYPGLLGIACCAFVLNCSAQTASPASETIEGRQNSSISVDAPQRAILNSGNGEGKTANDLPDSPSSSMIAREFPPQEQTSQTAAPAPNGAQQTNQSPQRPVGTAAAEAPKVNGITAAQPAGVAIAPAKQHRVRTIVLKVGAIVGAGAAVGTVVALTAGTSSKPPGAH